SGRAERFIILDVSRSMSYKTTDRPSPMELGKQAAADLVTQAGGDDHTAVLLTGSTTQVLMPLSRDAEAALSALRTVQAGSSETDLTSALGSIGPLLAHRRPDAEIELYVISDNQQQSWSQGAIASFLKELPVPPRVHVIDVGVGSPQNGWIADVRQLQ